MRFSTRIGVRLLRPRHNIKTLDFLAIEAWNTLGSVTDFDPVMLTVYGMRGPSTEALSVVPATEDVLTIANGNPGLTNLHIDVNGPWFRLKHGKVS